MISRRQLLLTGLQAAPAALLGAGCTTFLGHGRARRPAIGVRGYVRRAFEGLDRRQVWDSHAHIIGLGTGDSGCWVNDSYRTELYKSFLFDLYMTAGGVKDLADADREYSERLMRLVYLMNPRGRIVLMGFDYRVDEAGEPVPEKSEIYTPNDYIYRLAARFEQIAPCPSIHPYRKDALDRLDEAKAKGAVAIKWLPNAQAIDPAAPRLDAFYDKLVEHGLVLISHSGEEQAVDSAETQSMGNVLKLRRPLDRGVRVVVAHCAGLGHGEDLDARGAERQELESIDLFLRLMGEKQYEDNLFADISAMTQFNRSGRPLREVMLAKEIHTRLINGSDYPLPAVNPLVSTRWLQREGYLTRYQREMCNAVYRANPLLFDFVVKRSLRVIDDDGKERQFSDAVFETRWVFEGHTPKTRPLPAA